MDLNDTERGSCIHELFEAQVERTPDAVAVVFENHQLSYRELNASANQLAHHLRALGVAPEVLVGICVERSLEMVVGVMGILKAGGAYVPIDPAYPIERIAFMVEDSGMHLLLTQERLLKDLPHNDHRVIPIEHLGERTGLKNRENLAPLTRPQNLAYVIYTSGSTGRPKGVEVEHQSLVNLLHSMRRKTGMTDQDILLSVTTISFDMAVLDLFLPVTVGARVALVSREVASDGRRLKEQLENTKISMMQATPATWRMLLEACWKGAQTFQVLCGGEALSSDLAKALLERSAAVWNLYGPTETTVWSTVWRVDPSYGCISIGRPIANTQTHVLDSNLEPVPAGVVGELYIGGDGLARGYLNRSELTAEKFVPNPFNTEPGARLYKTGDLACHRPDGNIEFLGRIDHQAKIRGFRVELGEIEAVLLQLPALRDAVVLARDDTPGEKRLVAYVVPSQAQAPPTSNLRDFLKERLPDYMVPSAFVMLDALPLTPNGKVDRRALPAPDQTRPDLAAPFAAPRTPVEKALADIWAEVLGLTQVGVHDNFFELGGHSLRATQIVSRVRDAFQVELPLPCLFATPTIAGLAKIIEGSNAGEQNLRFPPIKFPAEDPGREPGGESLRKRGGFCKVCC